MNIDKLAKQIKLEREQFEKVQEENSRWQHNRLSKAAISIQTAFRGFRLVPSVLVFSTGKTRLS